MRSAYLSGLSKEEYENLKKQLWEQQRGKCFISGKPIDLELHDVDVDHVIPLRDNGKDDPTNFALAFSELNRSKQASDLRVARVLTRFDVIREEAESLGRAPNLGDVLSAHGGATEKLRVKLNGKQVSYVVNGNETVTLPLHEDKLSGMRYFFAVLPIECVHHDDQINPRPIGGSIRGLIEEFHKKRPQLHVALAWVDSASFPEATVKAFDGQHKAAAKVLLGAREVPLRIFVDPDKDILLTTNTNAGTTLRQVAFDKSVQRRLGSSLLVNRIDRFRKEKGFADNYEGFSEKALADHFKGEQRAIGKYVVDAVRDGILHSEDNKLRDYIEIAGRGTEKPFSYSAIEKTIYSLCIYQGLLETPWNHKADVGENPRELEMKQIVRLMTLIAEKIYIGSYEEAVGTAKLENKVQKGQDVTEPHLRAFRLAKEEVLHSWIRSICLVIENNFAHTGRVYDRQKLFQYPFPEQLWNNIGNFLDNLIRMPVWVDREASVTLFGAKQSQGYWQTIFETGSSPSGQKVLPSGLNITEMIKPA